MILINLQKAFDTINHKILFQKLKHIGLSPTAIEWITPYLTNRSNFVEIENTKSTLKDINCGVPQCSILGLLLFLLYINDMPQSVSCDLPLTNKDVTYTENELNKNLSSHCDWLVDKKLSIHLGKTDCIIFGTANKLKKK